MNKPDLKKVIIAQKEARQEKSYIARDTTIDTENPFINIVSGIRRCGKSTLVDHYRNQNPEQNYALNFDDERLTPFKIKDFEVLFESFQELFGQEKSWYLDEIQNIDGWERFVRRLHNEGHKVLITGSNASMLSEELGSRLTGRFVQTTLFPFSFREYLRFNKVHFTENDFYSPQKRLSIKNAFQSFIREGGFPEYLQTKNANYLKTLFENIMYRDVVARYGIRNFNTLAEMIHFLMSNIARETSYNALKNNFKYTNANSVKEHIGYFENAYMLFTVNKFDFSLKKQMANPKKFYCIDTGMANNVSFQFSENFGRKLENVVFLQLRRQTKDIFYHKNKHECDFVLTKSGRVTQALQVCQRMDDIKTRDREINGLKEAMESYNLKTGYIITDDDEETMTINGLNIHVIPCWKWLLGYTGETK